MVVSGTEELLRRGFFRWVAVRFRYTRTDGKDSGEVEHLVLERGDSVGVVLHDLQTDEIVLVEQLRIATLETSNGFLLEFPAGRIDASEQPIHAAIREAKEETGAELSDVQLISSFYLSPGTCSERLHLFYCPFLDGLTVKATGGLESEHEDLKVHRISLDQAMTMVGSGEIADAKTIIGVLWLKGARRP